jgi:hypothetical protein
MAFNLNTLQTAHTLTILPTYKCTAACQDCCFGSNPSIEGRIPQERILEHIKEAATIGMKNIVFSGGESFILGNDLDQAIWLATKLGMGTRVVTNGFWAITEEAAKNRLEKIQLSGLTEINFSTGDFHQRFVPIERVVNGAIASYSLGMRCVVLVEVRKGRSFSRETLLKDSRLSKILELQDKRNLLSIIESPWMPVYDSQIIPQDEALLTNRNNILSRKGCDSVLTTFVVDPSERLGACCGLTREQIPEMNMGLLKEKSMKDMVNEAFEDFLKIWIYVDGPEKILAWAATKDPSIEWENKYAHICHACRELYHDNRVREVIQNYHEEKLLDVYFKYWLLTTYRPNTSTEPHVNGDTKFFFG